MQCFYDFVWGVLHFGDLFEHDRIVGWFGVVIAFWFFAVIHDDESIDPAF